MTVYGTLAQGATNLEIFEFGWADMSALSAAALAAAVDGVMHSSWSDTVTNILQISGQALYGGVRVQKIDATGKVISSYNQAASSQPAGANTAMTNCVCCQCLTLETGVLDSKGRKVRGRIYPPAQSAGDPVVAVFTAASTQAYANNWAKLFTALHAAGAETAVASSTSAGVVAVTGISADNVVDTQRRRKNAITPTRSTVAAVTH